VYTKVKRILDISLVLLSLITLAPLLIIVALLISLESPGPIIHRKMVIGKGGRPFAVYKFRTTYPQDVNQEAYLRKLTTGELSGPEGDPVYKLKYDPRVTRVGRFLRMTSMDTLPQLLNVLRGNMSLVGPWPVQPFEWEHYSEWERERAAVLPGITGLAQLHLQRGISPEEAIKLDIEYVRQMSLPLDLRILAMTTLAVISGRGAY